jgi:hypothetical protein
MLTEAINNPNKPKLECKTLPKDVVGEYKPGRGIAINIAHSRFEEAKNDRQVKYTCSRWYVASTLLHEVVHWAWRREDWAYSCVCRCWEKNAKSCDWGKDLGCTTCKTPPNIGNYNTCLDCC